MEIVELEELKVVGLKVTCREELLSVEMPKLWSVFRERVKEIKNRTDNYVMDISLEVIDNNYTQCICTRVDNFNFIPDGMVGLTIPKQKYIHFTHKGPINEIWMSFWNMQKWAKENGFTVDPIDFKIDANEEDNDQIHKLYIKIV